MLHLFLHDILWVHRARNNSCLCCQSRCTWVTSMLGAWSICWLFWLGRFLHDVLLQPCYLSKKQSFHSAAAQMDFPLHCQLLCLHSCNHPTGHLPLFITELEYWPLLSFSNIWSQLDDLHFCKLALFIPSISSFCSLSYTALLSSLPPLTFSHNTTGSIN